MGPRERVDLISVFPGLAETPHAITSPSDEAYNCIAWAAGDNERWWWPNPHCFWPQEASVEESIEAFAEAFATLGYVRCPDEQFEDGFEKVALYGIDGCVKHAARLLRPGVWTSKLGRAIDIEHRLEGLFGTEYGKAIAFLKRAL